MSLLDFWLRFNRCPVEIIPPPPRSPRTFEEHKLEVLCGWCGQNLDLCLCQGNRYEARRDGSG